MSTTTATTQIYRVYIKAKPEAVWEAITKPEWTEKYGYGGQADYDLRPGGHYRGVASEEMRAMGAAGHRRRWRGHRGRSAPPARTDVADGDGP
jgi:uncharacterized protein YndB with AHSA1/START domain